jgi:hypothetical protein
MLEAARGPDRALRNAWRQSETPHDTRDRTAMLVVLIGGLVALIVVWLVSGGLNIAVPNWSDQPVHVLSGYQAAATQGNAACVVDHPSLDPSFAALEQRLQQEMGDPRECPRAGSGGDIVQQTAAGMAIKRAGLDLALFTNGVEHWALEPGGALVFWRGSSSDPPPDAQPLAEGTIRPSASPPQPPEEGEAAIVTGTDGVGVVLRASPRDRDWTPRGFMDGTPVRILERSGSDWARVRGANGQEGWVPSRYLGH